MGDAQAEHQSSRIHKHAQHVSLNDVSDKSNPLPQMLCSVEQWTEHMKKLQFAERLATLGKVASGIAHEINNPLGIILNRIECMEFETGRMRLSDEQQRDLHAIRTQADRISRVTKSMLALSRGAATVLKPMDVNCVLQSCIEASKERAATKGVHIEPVLAPVLPPVMGDRDRIERYDPSAMEPRWQARWAADRLYETDLADASKPRYYLLTMYPYPSGDLHIGHWYIKTPTDALARFHRMQGKNVFFPIGFDAFGLPAENAAIKNRINPRDWTFRNIDNMRRQLRSMGATFAWKHEVVTADPDYYRWNQWLFLRFLEAGLAYRAKAPVDWCPNDGTLAREQVEGVERRCWRCGSPVEGKSAVFSLVRRVRAKPRSMPSALESAPVGAGGGGSTGTSGSRKPRRLRWMPAKSCISR